MNIGFKREKQAIKDTPKKPQNQPLFITKGIQCQTWDVYYMDGFSLNKNFLPGKFSYLEHDSLIRLNLIPPVYISEHYLRELYNNNEHVPGDYLFKFFRQNSDGDLILTDQNVIDSQKGIFGEVFKQAAMLIFQGKGLIWMSLPIWIFEPKSQLQIIAQLFQNTKLVGKAALQEDPVKQIELIVCYILSNFVYGISIKKPFNPMLGETLQAVLEDNSELYVEHVMHDPPKDAFYIVNKQMGFTVSGMTSLEPDISPNELTLKFKGTFQIEIKNTKFYFNLPYIQNTGIMFGSRKMRLIGPVFVYCPQHKLKAIVEFGQQKGQKSDQLSGGVFYQQETLEINDKKLREKISGKNSYKTKNEKEQNLPKIQGSWLYQISFNQQIIWSNQESIKKYQLVQDPLPSDFWFREDILWLLYGFSELAQKWKLALEDHYRVNRAKQKNYQQQKFNQSQISKKKQK